LPVTGDGLLRAVIDNDAAGVFVLLKAGVDPNSRNSETKAGESPLFRVASCRPEIVRYLLDAGADVHVKDSFGRTPWDWVNGSRGPYAEEVLRALRQAGAAR
jgi:ankyrin repeat protein